MKKITFEFKFNLKLIKLALSYILMFYLKKIGEEKLLVHLTFRVKISIFLWNFCRNFYIVEDVLHLETLLNSFLAKQTLKNLFHETSFF